MYVNGLFLGFCGFVRLSFFGLISQSCFSLLSGFFASLKAIDATFGVDNFLLARKEWVRS